MSLLGLSLAVPGRSAVSMAHGAPATPPAQAASGPHGHKAVCGSPGPHAVRCNADVATDSSANPLVAPNVLAGSMSPVQFHTAYNLPCTPGGPVQSVCTAPASYSAQPIIAIVDAYLDPTVEYDLGVYDTQWGLPACTVANGCLTLLNENGGASLPTTVDGNWALETSLDVQTAHEICQTCRIMLLAATSNNWSDLAVAVNTAAALGVQAISNSYGGSEWAGETSLDSSYNHPGVAVVASSGDSGQGSQYPASSPYVVAAGGTTLTLNSDGTYQSEASWVDGGSGCSQYEHANSWEVASSNWSQTTCVGMRGATDVSADANPYTGAAVFDSTVYNGWSGWYELGGTSLSAPIIAATFALAGGVPSGMNAQQIPYSQFSTPNSHDITSGANGTCGNLMCNAASGYDGPTGLGSPNGTAGFTGANVPPPSSTPTATTSPTAIVTSTAIVTPTAGATSTPAPTPTSTVSAGDFTLSAGPSSQTIQQGHNGSYTARLTALGGYKSAVKLSVSGLPAGASATFNAGSVVPTNSGSNVTLQVNTSNSTAGGTYALTITGAGSDPAATTHTIQVTMVVPAFSLGLVQPAITVKRGTSSTEVVNVQWLGGYSSAVNLSVNGLPGGTSGSFSPSSVSPGTGTSTLTLTVQAGASTGSRTVGVTGSGPGAQQQKLTFTLTITS
jgi:subtilase family serine protease